MKPPPKPALLKKAATAVEKVKAGIPDPPKLPKPPFFARPSGRPGAADLAAAKLEVAALLAPVKKTRAGGSNAVKAVESYLIDHIARGGSYEDFVADMRGRTQAAYAKHRAAVDRAGTLTRLLYPMDKRQRYRSEVLLPARARRISGAEAWAATNSIVGRDMLRDDSIKPPVGFTLYPTIGADASFVIGAQYTIGVCGLLHGMVGFVSAVAVSIGAQAGATVAVGVSMGLGTPLDLANSTSLTVSLGVTVGYGFEVCFGYNPAILAPAEDPAVLLTPVDGLSVSISGGGDVELAVGFEHTEVVVI